MILAPAAHAAGFYLSEIGTPGSLGTAGVANPTNTISPDSAFTNPAGMTGLDEDQVLGGFQVLIPNIKFDPSIAEKGGEDGGNAGITAAIPSFFAVKTLGERTRLGFAVTAPLGGGVNYGDDFVGRYATIKAELAGLALSPSVGYRLSDSLSVGAGVSVLYTRFDQTVAVNLGPAPDGKVKLENADDWGTQPFVGLTWALSERTLLGAVYRAKADVDLKGDLNFRSLPVSPPINTFELSWDNPELLEIGLRYRLNPEWLLFANADWENWSRFSQNVLSVNTDIAGDVVVSNLDRQWKDTYRVGVAAARHWGQDRILSFGLSYDTSPVSDGKRTIDLPFDRTYKLSTSYAWTGPSNFDFAVGATLLYAGKGRTDQIQQGVRFKGDFETNLILIAGGTIRYVF
jgi:long-chain fatty acid transport protein